MRAGDGHRGSGSQNSQNSGRSSPNPIAQTIAQNPIGIQKHLHSAIRAARPETVSKTFITKAEKSFANCNSKNLRRAAELNWANKLSAER